MIRFFILILFVVANASLFSQSLNIFDIDKSDFPVMRAKFLAKNEDKYQLFYLDKKDFALYENGQERVITDISCPDTSNTVPLSSLLAIDISGSMGGRYLDLAADAARAWLEVLPFENSECAITTFCDYNSTIQSFTQEKYKLLSKLNFEGASGSTNFDAAFLYKNSGGLVVLEKGKYKKIMILITDGNGNGHEDEIIAKAKAMNATVFSVAISPTCPPILQKISEQTGGMWFENVNDPNKAADIYRKIFEYTQEGEPCTIEWISETACEKELRHTELICPALLAKDDIYYDLPDEGLTQLHISPAELDFGKVDPGKTETKSITVTAIGADFDVRSIKCDHGDFEIQPKSFKLSSGEQIQLDVIYNSKDLSYKVAKFTFEHSFCQRSFFCKAGDIETFTNYKNLKVVSPNGGEFFGIGSDTNITWQGSLPSDKVDISYSKDNGATWQNLVNTASLDLTSEWNNISGPESNKCLVKISMANPKNTPTILKKEFYESYELKKGLKIIRTNDGGFAAVGRTILKEPSDVTAPKEYDAFIAKMDNDFKIQWVKTIGGSKYDEANSLIQTDNDGFIILGSTKSSDKDIRYKNDDSYDVFVAKLDKSGNTLWLRTYGGSREDKANDIIKTENGDYVISAVTKSIDGDLESKTNIKESSWTLKLDVFGDVIWQNIFENRYGTRSNSLLRLPGDSYLVLGQTSEDDKYLGVSNCGFAQKISSDGTIEWTTNLNGANAQDAKTATITEAGNILVACSHEKLVSESNLLKDYFWLVELKNDGTIANKSRLFGGDGDDIPSSIIRSQTGEFFVIGTTNSSNGDVANCHSDYSTDIWVSKFSKDMHLLWEYSLGGTKPDDAHSVIESSPGVITICGGTYSQDGDAVGNTRTGTFCLFSIEDFTPDEVLEDVSDAVFSIVEPELSADNIDMGKVVVGLHRDTIINDFIRNSGSYPCKVKAISISNDIDSAFTWGNISELRTLYPGNKQDASFRFSPNRLGDFSADILIEMDHKYITRTIIGEGIKRDVDVTQDNLNFGTIQVFSSKDTIATLIKNNSDRAINITDVSFQGYNPDHFKVLDHQPFSLAAGKTHEFKLRYNPTVIGRSSSDLVVNYDGAGDFVKIRLYGAGIGAKVSVSIDSAKASENVNIDIMFDNGSTKKLSEIVGSFECTVKFESSILGVQEGFKNVFYNNDSTFLTVSNDIDAQSNILATLPLKAMLGKVRETAIKIGNFKWFDINGNQMFFESDYVNGHFKLLDICEEGGSRFFNPNGSIEIAKTSPNPASNQIEIEFSVAEKGHTEIILTNMLGETVASFFSENISDTRSRSIVRNISHIGSGHYTLQLKTPSSVKQQKIVIIK